LVSDELVETATDVLVLEAVAPAYGGKIRNGLEDACRRAFATRSSPIAGFFVYAEWSNAD
jgi:hypothetical protein